MRINLLMLAVTGLIASTLLENTWYGSSGPRRKAIVTVLFASIVAYADGDHGDGGGGAAAKAAHTSSTMYTKTKHNVSIDILVF